MKSILITIVLLILSANLFAQEKSPIRKNQGIFNITEIGYLPSVGNVNYSGYSVENSAQTYRLRTIFGYFLNPYLSVGLGVGLDGYHDPTYNTMPLFVEGRGYLWNSRNTPYVFLDLGKAIKAGEAFEEGFFSLTWQNFAFVIANLDKPKWKYIKS